jgi:hypothetical protein
MAKVFPTGIEDSVVRTLQHALAIHINWALKKQFSRR